ncbi:MAG TPA: hypothetical protein VEI07_23655 [Planctomycetaceae bacterium]|nr:hypothetical protein [Planctomycetaceae bacterium]
MSRLALPQVIERLRAQYGEQKAPRLTGPWEMILWENVAYLADDESRRAAFEMLKKRIGLDPQKILAASDAQLLKVSSHGILAGQFAKKLRKCAKIALEEFDGDLRRVLKLPAPKAKKALQRFPGIGEPGAEKILLFNRVQPVLAMDSNGLRVLLRLGFGEEKKSYATSYRIVQRAVEEQLQPDSSWLIEAHLLLRRHGQELCKRSRPACDECPLASDCEFRRAGG